jgi:two-component system cell cycle response regulator
MPHKILLIDDSITQLEMLKLHFLETGYEVVTAKDGVEGYRMVFECAPDLILSDIIMPNLNGYQLCRLLKNNPLTQQIPIILLTVLDKKIDKFWGNKSGADKFISKTTKYKKIEEIVIENIEKKPISDEYKNKLLVSAMNNEAIHNQINSIFDELLMNSTFLNEFRDLGEFLTHEKVLIEKTFDLLSSFVDYNIAGLFFNNSDKHEKNILHLDIGKNPISGFIIEKIKRDFFSQMPGIENFTIRDFGHEIVKEPSNTNKSILNLEQFNTIHILPFISNDKLVGGVCFYNVEECNYPGFKFYKTMLDELLLLLKMRYLYAQTEYLSVTDGLTGLYNRRHFECNIEREFLRTKRYPSDLSLAIIDIDHFKNINDSYGHQFGDYVLKEISNIMANSFRKTDMIYRYGGEELAIILTGTSINNAFVPLERFKNNIAQHAFSYNDETIKVTISIGLSSNFTNIETQTELIESADKALYKAKQSGRNQVVIYSHEHFNIV